MDINKMKAMPYDELRTLYRSFLSGQKISKATINTAYAECAKRIGLIIDINRRAVVRG